MGLVGRARVVALLPAFALVACANLTAPPTDSVAARPRVTQPAASAAASATMRASHILLQFGGRTGRNRDETRILAERVLNRLKAGEDFAALARQYSADRSQDTGGDLGQLRREQLVPAFGDALFALPLGGLSGIVETQFGFHIIKRTA